MSTLTPRKQKSLSELTTRVNALHLRIEQALRTAILLAKETGALLYKIKKRLGHGEFGDWLENNFASSPETARVYMRISQKWYRLKSEFEGDQDLTIARATEILRVPKALPPPPPPPKGQFARDELRETFLIHLEKWTDDDVMALAAPTDKYPNHLDECLASLLFRIRVDR